MNIKYFLCFGFTLIFLGHYVFLQKERQMTLSVAHLERVLAEQMANLPPPQPQTRHSQLVDELWKKMQLHQQYFSSLLVELAKGVHAPVCFSTVRHQDHATFFVGYARSLLELSTFIQAWRRVAIFSSLHLIKVEEKPEQRLFQFEFRTKE